MGAHRGRECHYRKSFGEGCCSRSGRIPRRGAAVLRKAAQREHTPFPMHKQCARGAPAEGLHQTIRAPCRQHLRSRSIHVQSGTDSSAGPAMIHSRIQEVFMTRPRALAIASVVVLGTHPVAAQDLSHYRAYTLESSVAEVVTISEARDADVKSLHERPARIQQLEWRPRSVARSRGCRPRSGHQLSFLQRRAVPAPCNRRSRAYGRSDQRRRHRVGVRGVWDPTAPARRRP